MESEELVRLLTPEERAEQLLIEADRHSARVLDYYTLAAHEQLKAERCMQEARKIRKGIQDGEKQTDG